MKNEYMEEEELEKEEEELEGEKEMSEIQGPIEPAGSSLIAAEPTESKIALPKRKLGKKKKKKKKKSKKSLAS
tara:strand:+ start:412 stop:630 length:219 start_codon:yes stop_codon:yes gene_type:complete